LKITVYFEPKDVKPTVVTNATVVLVDVLRVTSTIPVLLFHGAKAVNLCPDPGTAKKAFEKLKRGEGLLAGERDWEKIPGFHMGCSPLDSSREKVKGRIVCLSSPSKLRPIKNAQHVIMGSFVNLGEVYDSCLRGKRDVVVVCSGGQEDSVFAGMLVDFLQSTLGSNPVMVAESAKEAIALYRPWQGRILDLLRESPEGKQLIQKGHTKDLDYCSKTHRISAVPFLKDGLFAKEDAPKKRFHEDGKPKAPVAPQKGKSIKVTVPLFPKNPEHPVPGMDKGVKKGQHPAHDSKKHDDKKHEDKKGGDKKGEKVLPKKPEVKSPGGKGKKPVVHKPLFSKKTVATAPVKMIRKVR